MKKKKLRISNTPIITKVILFSTQDCPACQLEIRYLKARKINFETKHVDANLGALKEMISSSQQLGVPFTVVKKQNGTEEKILGFDEAKLAAALGLN